jgi:plasmid maintenance system antidote protein VapI
MSPEDLRAEIARRQVRLYQLASQIGVHPGRLGQMLNERISMPSDVADRVAQALKSA